MKTTNTLATRREGGSDILENKHAIRSWRIGFYLTSGMYVHVVRSSHKQPLTANHVSLPGSLMAEWREERESALCVCFSLILCLYIALYTKHSVCFLLSRSLHLHCSFPPSLHHLYSHCTSLLFYPFLLIFNSNVIIIIM